MMIEINLVPVQLRKRRKSVSSGKATSPLRKQTWILAVGTFVAVVLLVVMSLQALIFRLLVRQNNYQKEISKLMTKKNEVDKIIDQIKQTKTMLTSLQKIVGEKEVVWSQKFNELSDALPRGLWLNRLTLQGDVLLINGSAVAINQGDMVNVHNFTSSLKTSPAFGQDFRTVEIDLIKSRDISGTTIADFTIRAEFKKVKK